MSNYSKAFEELIKKLKQDTNSLYSKTGFILLEDTKNRLFYYDKDKYILIPCDQGKIFYPNPRANRMLQIGEKEYPNQSLYIDDAIGIFTRLQKIPLCRKWDIERHIWKLSYAGYMFRSVHYNTPVYDGRKQTIRERKDDEDVFELQSFYLGGLDPTMWGYGTAVLQELKIAKNQEYVSTSNKQDKEKNMTVVKNVPQVKKIPSEVKNVSVPNKTNPKEEKAYLKALLECDKRRCRLDSYEESILYDIKRGHWDLFGVNKSEKGLEINNLVSRDPRKDIKNGIVGIDFGTKSTVVVRQDDTNRIIPVRIGTGGLSVEIKESDFENPTIIECMNLKEFLKKYSEKAGRPETSCDDFFVSYDALNDFCSCPADEFYAYYMELKQWANREKTDVSVLDKQNMEYQFGEYSSENDNMINPIELYAYYIGMYINNMRNGIYMKYLMSFPVGYSKETRQFIKNSFEKGIKKSLPACVLEDADCMKKFDMQLGISEPAAYAVTALEMSGLDPKDENEKYMYGIFDFGGGTTDFDFGIWRGASDDENEIEGYDYVLECFGADSDVTLGGENILELLAYAIFKDNKEMAGEKKITCSLPIGETAFLGSELLISNSQIAKRNMSILKEELRPLWHQEDGWEEKYRHEIDESQGGKDYEEYIELSLYDMEGKQQPNCRFIIDTDKLMVLIKTRIQSGIDAFFRCMEKTFQFEEKVQEQEDNLYKLYIFLAGNSSKSVFVKEIFEETIQRYYSKFKELDKRAGNSYFQLIEPLTAEYEKDSEQWINAKTGVAYGLIKSRDGSTIKVVKNNQTNAEEQARFKYYLGREKRKHFECKLSPVEIPYGSWIRFQGAAKPIVRIYYTTNPIADSKLEQLAIDGIAYKEIAIEPEEGAFIYIRTCKPTMIEYVISPHEEDIREDSNICSIDFDMQGE